MYRSRALKSRSKLKAAIGLKAAFGKFLLHQYSSLCTVTFGEKVLTLAMGRGSSVRGYGIHRVLQPALHKIHFLPSNFFAIFISIEISIN